jgi:hypothetical protein
MMTIKKADLLDAAIALLQSGSDDGCDQLVVVDLGTFLALRQLVEQETGECFGDVRDDYEVQESEE